jgi:hypothetical protein
LKAALRKGLIKVKKKAGEKANETRIVPRISLIEKELESRKREDSASQRIRFVGPEDTITRNRSPPRDSVTISDSVDRVVTPGPTKLLLSIIQSSPCALPDP